MADSVSVFGAPRRAGTHSQVCAGFKVGPASHRPRYREDCSPGMTGRYRTARAAIESGVNSEAGWGAVTLYPAASSFQAKP